MKSQEVELSSLHEIANELEAEVTALNLKNEELEQSLDDKELQLMTIVCSSLC